MFDTSEIRCEWENFGNAIKWCECNLEGWPCRCKLPEWCVEIIHIELESYEKPYCQISLLNEINTKTKCCQLCDIGCKSIESNEKSARDSGCYVSSIVLCICFLEFLSEIIETIEGNDHLEIGYTFLNFRTHIAKCLETFEVFLLDPWGDKLGNYEDSECWKEAQCSKLKTQDEHEYACTSHEKNIANKLDESLGNELIEFIGIIVDTRDEVTSLILMEESNGKILKLRKEGISKIIEDSTSDASHGFYLNITRETSDKIDHKQDHRKIQNTWEILF